MNRRNEFRAGPRGGGRARVTLVGSAALETPAERALNRVLRSGHQASVLRLFVSRVHAAALRPHHGRVARCLFDDMVQTAGGQVFACTNGDLVLIAGPEAVSTLASIVLRVFRAEIPADQQVIGLWSLPEDAAQVRAEFAVSSQIMLPADDEPAPLGTIAAIGTALAAAQGGNFIRRQTAIRIAGSRVMPFFDELSVSMAELEERIGFELPSNADPYLCHHMAGQLDRHMLTSLAMADFSGTPALHINLPLAAMDRPELSAVNDAARRAGTLLGVEIALVEALANFADYDRLRTRLQNDGCTVVLDGVNHHALLRCDPPVFRPDLLKLEWSPLMPALPLRDQRRLHRAITTLGADRVVLGRAETEQALVWGLEAGIRCFQGRHVDLMLAADRIRTCAHSAGCTLRQCIDRAAAVDEAGQLGCLDPTQFGRRPHWAPNAELVPAA